MAITAKFRVSRLTPSPQMRERKDEVLEGENKWEPDPDKPPRQVEVEMTPDYAGGRNAAWSEATPSGVIRLNISNPGAFDQFILGKAFDILFTENEE